MQDCISHAAQGSLFASLSVGRDSVLSAWRVGPSAPEDGCLSVCSLSEHGVSQGIEPNARSRRSLQWHNPTVLLILQETAENRAASAAAQRQQTRMQ